MAKVLDVSVWQAGEAERVDMKEIGYYRGYRLLWFGWKGGRGQLIGTRQRRDPILVWVMGFSSEDGYISRLLDRIDEVGR